MPPGAVRTRIPNNRAAGNTRLWPRGLWDRQCNICGEIIWNLSPLIVLKLGKGALVGAGTSVDGNSDVRVFNVFIWISENSGLNTRLNPLAPLSATPIFPGICRIVAAASMKAVAYPGILFGGGGAQQIQLRTEDGENGDLGAVAP